MVALALVPMPSLIWRRQGPAPTPLSLPDVVHWFKTITTKRYVDGVKHSGWPPFYVRLWHHNYVEHSIRNETSLARIREYIANNPLQWGLDPENHSKSGTWPPRRGTPCGCPGP